MGDAAPASSPTAAHPPAHCAQHRLLPPDLLCAQRWDRGLPCGQSYAAPEKRRGWGGLFPAPASSGFWRAQQVFLGEKKERKKENQRQSFPVSRNLLPIRALPGASAWFSGANDSSAECFFQGPRWRQTAGFAFTQDFAHKRPRTSPVASITRGVDSSPGASAGGADRATARTRQPKAWVRVLASLLTCCGILGNLFPWLCLSFLIFRMRGFDYQAQMGPSEGSVRSDIRTACPRKATAFQSHTCGWVASVGLRAPPSTAGFAPGCLSSAGAGDSLPLRIPCRKGCSS